jgi:predicted SprT family Zn-dependent metalloprotease
MRDLIEYACKAMEMLDSIGIEYGNIIDFTVNTRAHKRWGQCRKVPGGYSININATLLDERNSEDGLMNTILHELAHTVDGCYNHGAKWKKVANEIYLAFGYKVKRTNSAEEKGVLQETEPKIIYKYQFRCKKRGRVVRRERASKFTQHYDLYRCGCCGGHFEKI